MNEDVRIETYGPMELMGVVLYGNPKKVQFHTAWEHFGKLANDLSIPLIGKNLYGIQIYPPWFPSRFEITYMASIEKEPGFEVPIRMLTKTIPRCKYVVQKVVGGVDGIDQVIRYLYKEYMPKNKLTVAMPLDFEKYCNVENQNAFSGNIEVWIPIDGHM